MAWMDGYILRLRLYVNACPELDANLVNLCRE